MHRCEKSSERAERGQKAPGQQQRVDIQVQIHTPSGNPAPSIYFNLNFPVAPGCAAPVANSTSPTIRGRRTSGLNGRCNFASLPLLVPAQSLARSCLWVLQDVPGFVCYLLPRTPWQDSRPAESLNGYTPLPCKTLIFQHWRTPHNRSKIEAKIQGKSAEEVCST